MDVSYLYLTCDKNFDLVFFLYKSIACLNESNIDGVVITETNAQNYDGIKSINSNTTNFAKKIELGLKNLRTKYVLVLLDDYLVHDSKLAEKINFWNSELSEGLICLRINPNKHLFKSICHGKIKLYKRLKIYDIDFHPTIWKRDFLLKIVEDKDYTPWQIEPLFSKYLVDKKVAISHKYIDYSELVIQGKFFRKEYKKFCAGTYNGDRRQLSFIKNSCYKLKFLIYHLVPRCLIDFLNKFSKKKRYSDLVEEDNE